MDKLDELIREALEGEDKRIFEETAELGYFALAMGIFRGRTGWVSWVVMLVQGAMFLAAIWCAVQFYAASEVLLAVKWGISAAVLALMAGMMKMSLMPVMQADRVLRELKRVELMLARGAE
ncbi:MAG: hypothetical protein GY945_13670 [Rhodobacteraceae bacterium]|nr:hypothetical protein [Paracoccaceae bacterium]